MRFSASSKKAPKLLNKAGAILITSDNYIIVVQNRYQTDIFNGKGSIGLPKGTMKAGETFQDCAMREVKEEIGISIVIPPNIKTRRISGVKFFIIRLNLTKNTFLNNHWLHTNDTYEISGILLIPLQQLVKYDKYYFNSSLSYFTKLVNNNPEFTQLLY